MLPSLCMCEVRAVILVYRKAQATLEASNMVLKEVWVLVEVDCLERKLAQALSSIGIGG